MNNSERYDILIETNEDGNPVIQIKADGKRLKHREAICALCDFVIQDSSKTGYEKALDMTAFFRDGETRFKVEKKFDAPPRHPITAADYISAILNQPF